MEVGLGSLVHLWETFASIPLSIDLPSVNGSRPTQTQIRQLLDWGVHTSDLVSSSSSTYVFREMKDEGQWS
jgi:hypothetical protein